MGQHPPASKVSEGGTWCNWLGWDTSAMGVTFEVHIIAACMVWVRGIEYGYQYWDDLPELWMSGDLMSGR
jgi:hypothetical protein